MYVRRLCVRFPYVNISQGKLTRSKNPPQTISTESTYYSSSLARFLFLSFFGGGSRSPNKFFGHLKLKCPSSWNNNLALLREGLWSYWEAPDCSGQCICDNKIHCPYYLVHFWHKQVFWRTLVFVNSCGATGTPCFGLVMMSTISLRFYLQSKFLYNIVGMESGIQIDDLPHIHNTSTCLYILFS